MPQDKVTFGQLWEQFTPPEQKMLSSWMKVPNQLGKLALLSAEPFYNIKSGSRCMCIKCMLVRKTQRLVAEMGITVDPKYANGPVVLKQEEKI